MQEHVCTTSTMVPGTVWDALMTLLFLSEQRSDIKHGKGALLQDFKETDEHVHGDTA